MKLVPAMMVVLSACTAACFGADAPKVDQTLPKFADVVESSKVSLAGNLRTAGSDTLGNVVGLWTQEFRKHYPAVQTQVEAKGSSIGPPALMEGQAQFAPMSRAMDSEERDTFSKKFGYEPTQLRIAIDCVAIFVHKDCPLDSLTLEQVREIFSVAGSDKTWGDLGVSDPSWASRPVSVYGRNSASGTYKYFKKEALGGSDFKSTVKEAPGSAGVISAVATDRYAMGYSGIGFKTPDVKAVSLSFDEYEDPAPPSLEMANSGDYPLARFMYMYVNYDRKAGIDRLQEMFVRMTFSQEGQEAVIKDGSYPVTARVAREELKKLGLTPGF